MGASSMSVQGGANNASVMNNAPSSVLKVRNDLMPQTAAAAVAAAQAAAANNANQHFGNNGVGGPVPGTVNTPSGMLPNNSNRGSSSNKINQDAVNASSATVSGSPGSNPGGGEGPKTKAMLKGWSSLVQSSSAKSAQERQLKASDTFNAFKKAAQEKADRERVLQEQQESQRMKKLNEERQRKQEENERRREEEEALEQARRAMMIGAKSENSNSSGQNHFDQQADEKAAQEAAEAQREAEKARERQRQREQERRRREAKANQIDMNMQSDLMAAFEENII